MKRHTILGSGGAIGSALAAELQQLPNVSVRTVQRRAQQVAAPHEHLSADLTQASEVERAIQGSDIVYLTVGFPYRIAVWEREWPLLVQRVIAACAQGQARLIFFDNVYMYAPSSVGNMTENLPFQPESRKGKVRATVASMILKAIEQGHLQGMIARSADFFGPGVTQTSILYQMVFKPMLAGQKPMWPVNADVPHAFTYVPDAAKALVQLAQTDDAYGKTWHLPTTNPGLTGRAWIALVSELLNKQAHPWVLPPYMFSVLGLFMRDLAESKEMLYQYDRPYQFLSTAFEERFGWKPTPYETGARAVIAHSQKTNNS